MAGALLAIAVSLPVSVAVSVAARLARGGDGDDGSPLWVVPVMALFAGFFLGGRRAARLAPEAPLRNSAASAAAAFAVLAAAAVVRRVAAGQGISTPLVLTLLLLLQITVSLSMLAGYGVMRTEARRQRGGEALGEGRGG